MTRDNLATVPVGTSEAEARKILHQRRIEKLLEALDSTSLPLTNTEALRGVRAIEVLERARTPAAKMLLQSWADQPVKPRLAAEARQAVERLRLGDSLVADAAL